MGEVLGLFASLGIEPQMHTDRETQKYSASFGDVKLCFAARRIQSDWKLCGGGVAVPRSDGDLDVYELLGIGEESTSVLRNPRPMLSFPFPYELIANRVARDGNINAIVITCEESAELALDSLCRENRLSRHAPFDGMVNSQQFLLFNNQTKQIFAGWMATIGPRRTFILLHESESPPSRRSAN
jgi:hypothetical protein